MYKGLIKVNNTQIENTVLQVPIEDIIPNRFQPRLAFDDASLNDLASSIKQHGIIQPLVLRRKNDKYEIIAGERRYKASKLAGLTSVPAVISNLDDNASAEVAIVENIQRKDLTSIEEAKSYQALLDKGYITQEELARKMGLSQSAISNKLRLLTLDESVQDAILAEKISERHARTLLKVPSHEKQRELLTKIINERLTVKQLEDLIKGSDTSSITEQPKEEVTEELIENPQVENLDILEENPKIDINSYPSIEDVFNESEVLKDNLFEQPNESEVLNDVVTPESYFNNPSSMPNKFFNFLEDSAVNMNISEITPTFNLEDNEPISDGIELLDDLSPVSNEKQEYLDYVLKTIRGLNLDTNKVTIEEMNLPTEYRISIKIKKEDNNN